MDISRGMLYALLYITRDTYSMQPSHTRVGTCRYCYITRGTHSMQPSHTRVGTCRYCYITFTVFQVVKSWDVGMELPRNQNMRLVPE